MRTYLINCLQGTGFCSWSYDNPPTRAQIIEHFNEFREIEGLDFPKKMLNLRFISKLWEVSIIPTTKNEANYGI